MIETIVKAAVAAILSILGIVRESAGDEAVAQVLAKVQENADAELKAIADAEAKARAIEDASRP